jgi:chemotaxis protein methyltransferase CheR
MVKNGKFKEEFINAFTTNKTHFFRESFHFDDLKERVFKNAPEKLKVFSSASSTGEEPYSIAITHKIAKEQFSRGFELDLLATDIDTDVLKFAKDGIYEDRGFFDTFPNWVKANDFFQRRIDGNKTFYKIKDEFKSIVKFKQLNLMDAKYPFSEGEFDVIFCRNVLIYFSKDDQSAILSKLIKALKVGGTLYLGHSENPYEFITYLNRLGHNIFVKK